MLAPCCCVTRLSEIHSVSIPTNLLHLKVQFLPVLLLPLQSSCTECLSLHRPTTKALLQTKVFLWISKCRFLQLELSADDNCNEQQEHDAKVSRLYGVRYGRTMHSVKAMMHYKAVTYMTVNFNKCIWH